MSNCIEIKNCAVTFAADEIDIPKLKADIEEKKDGPPFIDSEHGSGTMNNMVYWFLNDYNVSFKEDSVTIRFGAGRSSHTNRDFRGIINYLSDFMLKSKSHTFTIYDEYDGFQTPGRMEVTFSPKVEAPNVR